MRLSLALMLGVAAAGLSGCRGVQPVVTRETEALGRAWEERASAFPDREELVLSWPEARALLLERNLALRKAAEDRERARKRIGQVYRDLLPYTDLQAGLNKRLTELDDLSSRDFRLDLNAYAFLSGLLSLRRDLYAAELGWLRAGLVRRLAEREKTVELHRAFLASAQWERAVRRREEQERLWAAAPPVLRRRFAPEARSRTLREAAERGEELLQTRLSELLNQPGRRVRLTHETPLPGSLARPPDIADAERTGWLRRNLVAVELTGARARVQGVRMEYWPDVRAYLTSGPLWRTSDGETIWWSKEDLWTSVNVRMPIDIRGNIGRRLREAKADLALLEEELALRDAALLAEFAARGEALRQTERDLAALARDREALGGLIALEGLETLATRLPSWTGQETRRAALEAQRDDLKAFFLFFDEAFWTTLEREDETPAACLQLSEDHAHAHKD